MTRRTTGPGRPPARAFTLVELLLVIALAALLMGLMAPGLAGLRGAARRSRCQANLRQMALAAHSYAAIWDRFPAAIRYEQVQGTYRQVAWDWVTTFSGELIGPGPLWSFTDNPGNVQQCPEYRGPTNFAGDPYTGYNYNTTYIGAEARFPQTGWDAVRWGAAPHACDRASTCAMFGDGGRAGGTNKFMRAPLRSVETSLSEVYAGGQAFRHGRSTCLAFADGHVGLADHAFEGALATDALLQEVMGYPRNGFLSDDDRAYDPR